MVHNISRDESILLVEYFEELPLNVNLKKTHTKTQEFFSFAVGFTTSGDKNDYEEDIF